MKETDLISRQAALDAFGLSEKTRKYGGDHSGYGTRMLYEIQDVLEGLPPAVPDGRYINADELIKRLKQEGLNDAVEIAVKMAGHERVGKRGW